MVESGVERLEMQQTYGKAGTRLEVPQGRRRRLLQGRPHIASFLTRRLVAVDDGEMQGGLEGLQPAHIFFERCGQEG